MLSNQWANIYKLHCTSIICLTDLSPDEELEIGCQLGLGRVGVLGLENGLVHLTSNLDSTILQQSSQ